MNRPLFLTRAQRVSAAWRRVLPVTVVFGLFVGLGVVLAVGLTQ